MSRSLTDKPDKLTADAIDDLIYACRTNALDSLQEDIPRWADQLNTTESDIISQAIDVDEEGLGSRACLLHYPAANGNLEMIQWLLERLKTKNDNALSQIDIAAGASAPRADGVNRAGAGDLLVDHQNVSGNTPLHWAALNGHIEIVKALVGAGADPTIVNGVGRDAVVEAEYSAQTGAEECANWLLKECEALEQGAGEGMAGMGEQDRVDGNDDDENDDKDKGKGVDGEQQSGRNI